MTEFYGRVECQWYIYWAQNLPGYGNTIEYDADNYMTNWWEFTADFDMAVETNLGVHRPKPLAVHGDLNGDGVLDFNSDFAVFLSLFGHSVTPGEPPDYDGDGIVGLADYSIFCSYF